MPGWRHNPDEDLHALAVDIAAGLVTGTWQYPTWGARTKAFPGFDGDRDWSWMSAVHGSCYSTPEAAVSWAVLPPFAEAYVRGFGSSAAPPMPPFDPSEIEVTILTVDQWQILAPLIGYPRSTLSPSFDPCRPHSDGAA